MIGGGDDTMSETVFHPLDVRILEILQEQGRISNVQLAAKVGLSPSAVLERVRKLEERESSSGTRRSSTTGDRARDDRVRRRHPAPHQAGAIQSFHRFVRRASKVLECYHVAGAEDYSSRCTRGTSTITSISS